jgi:hypothetical protein
MEEDVVIVLEDGTKICPSCVAGQIKVLGGPIKVGIKGADDPNVLFLCQCDICEKNYKLKNEEYRLRILASYPEHFPHLNGN